MKTEMVDDILEELASCESDSVVRDEGDPEVRDEWSKCGLEPSDKRSCKT
jgi:hypothetical protein